MTHRRNNEYNHQGSLRDGCDFQIGVPRKEEQRAEADLLDVYSDKHMGDGFGEENSASVSIGGLLLNPNEEVLPHHCPEHEE